MPDDHEETIDEDFLLCVLIAQTKDALLRAREREYARFGNSIDLKRERDRLALFLRKLPTRMLQERSTPELPLALPRENCSVDA